VGLFCLSFTDRGSIISLIRWSGTIMSPLHWW
jgi:hypothetical protein